MPNKTIYVKMRTWAFRAERLGGDSLSGIIAEACAVRGHEEGRATGCGHPDGWRPAQPGANDTRTVRFVGLRGPASADRPDQCRRDRGIYH